MTGRHSTGATEEIGLTLTSTLTSGEAVNPAI